METASNVQQASGEARHTPGEWRWSRLNWRNETDNARLYICAETERGFSTGVCIVEGNGTSQITTKANANLIAAAPDLLAACEAAAAALDYGYVLTKRSGAECPAVTDAVAKIYAAIAKAKGGAA